LAVAGLDVGRQRRGQDEMSFIGRALSKGAPCLAGLFVLSLAFRLGSGTLHWSRVAPEWVFVAVVLLWFLGLVVLSASLGAHQRRCSVTLGGVACVCAGTYVAGLVLQALSGSGMRFYPRDLHLAPIGFCALFVIALLAHGICAHIRDARHRPQDDTPRCGKCGYILTGLTEARCPECFTPFDPESLGNRACSRTQE